MDNTEKKRLNNTPYGINVLCDWYVTKADNSTLWDQNGKEYIDFAAGIAVLNTGHRHPKVIDAVQNQLKQFTHTCYQITPYESYVNLAEKINNYVPISGSTKCCFFTTGAEAIENAIKIAKAHTKRFSVISFVGSFHGRTAMAMTLTGKMNPYKYEFGSLYPNVFHAAFPGETSGVSVKESLDSLERLFKSTIHPEDVAAIIVEPEQGEGGFNPAPKEFFIELRKICDKYGIVLIADEVQTGFARTGKLFAMEHHDIEADIITMAKGIAGGFPLSGLVGRSSIMDSVNPGGLGGTYAGNPVSISAALAVINIIEDENLCERANILGKQLKDTLFSLNSSLIKDVRGLGSMVGVEFKDEDGNHNPDFALKVQKKAMERGLLLLTCGLYGNVIRFLYPLTIPQDQFNKALKIITEIIKEQ